MPCFLFFHKQSEPAVPNLRFKVLLKKHLKNPQNFCTKHANLFWQKLLGFQRTFHEKSFGRGLGRTAPTFNATHKKHGNAVLFILTIALLKLRIFANGIFYHFKHTHGALFHERARKRSAFDRRNDAFDIAP